jgi:hypothetical protein
MKLNAAEIREIEKFLTAREKGLTNGAIGAYFGLGDHAQQKASVAFGVLAKLGVRVGPQPERRGRPPGPKNKFRSQARPEAVSVQPARNQPVRLSAEQWQERLSAHGF